MQFPWAQLGYCVPYCPFLHPSLQRFLQSQSCSRSPWLLWFHSPTFFCRSMTPPRVFVLSLWHLQGPWYQALILSFSLDRLSPWSPLSVAMTPEWFGLCSVLPQCYKLLWPQAAVTFSSPSHPWECLQYSLFLPWMSFMKPLASPSAPQPEEP